MHRLAFVTLLTLLAASTSVYAADGKPNNDKSSTVDTRGQETLAPGTHPASPGTVGALNAGSGGSFTAPKSDQKKMNLK